MHIRRYFLATTAGLAFVLAGTSLVSANTTDPAITVALATEPDSLDSCDTQPAQNANIARGNIYQSLTHVKAEDGKLEPLLAQSWVQTSELVWEFKLQPNVKFHDGSAFDAKTVAANVMRTQAGFTIDGKATACLNSGQIPDPVTAEAVDDLTLRVTTNKPDPILPLRLSYIDIGGITTQATAAKSVKPIGTGPYQFVDRVQGQHVKLSRFDGYWGKKPQVKDVTYVFRADPSVRRGMIATGEAQIATAISSQHATTDDRTVEFKDNRVVLYRLRHDKEPFVDPRVRQAVSKAIDRDTLVKVLMGRTGSPWYQMLGPQVNGYIADFDEGPLKYDPDGARELIAAAKADGHDVDAEFLLVTKTDLFPGSNEFVQAISQFLQEVGLKPRILSIEMTAWRTYLRQPFPEGQQSNMLMISHDNTSGDASFSYPRYITCKGTNSSTCNSEIDRLIKEADAAPIDERAKLYQAAAKILHLDEMTMEGLAEQVQLMMLGQGVNYKPNPLTGIEILISDVTVN